MSVYSQTYRLLPTPWLRTSRKLPLLHQSTMRRPTSVPQNAYQGRPRGSRTMVTLPGIIESISGGIISIHGMTGMPYWLLIPVLAGTFVGTVNIPAMILHRRQQLALNQLIGLRMAWFAQLHRLRVPDSKGEALKQYDRMKRELGPPLWKEYGVKLSTVAAFILVSVAFRDVAGVGAAAPMDPALATEGILWFTNMAAPDPLRLLPIISGGMMMANFVPRSVVEARILLDRNLSGPSLGARRFGLIFTPIFTMLAAGWPAAVWWFWLSRGVIHRVAQKALRLSLPEVVDPFIKGRGFDTWYILGPKARGKQSK